MGVRTRDRIARRPLFPCDLPLRSRRSGTGLFRDGRRFPFEGPFLDQSLQEGQGERRRLARAGLGDSENIRAPQDDRNSRCWMGVSSSYPFSRTAFKIGSAMFSSLNVIMISGPHSRTFLVIGRPRRPDKNGEIVSGFPTRQDAFRTNRKDKRHREQEP